jgi:hypothetical protein
MVQLYWIEASMEETLRDIGHHAAAAAERFIAFLWEVYHHHQEEAHFPEGCANFLAEEWEVVAWAAHEKGPARRVQRFSTLLEGLREAEELYDEHTQEND